MPGACVTTALVVLAWAYFIWTGSISTIWPMFGVANQLLACVALSVGTTILVNMGKVQYIWVTLVPLMFLSDHHAHGRLSEREESVLGRWRPARTKRCTSRATSRRS